MQDSLHKALLIEMAQASPTRRALVDLPVNTLGTPSSMHNTDKPFSSHKRAIDEVEEPEYTQPASRVCVSPSRPESTARNMTQPEELSKPMPHGLEVLEEMGEGDSPNSYKDSMSSLVDFDPDETMASQQTTATELTQPLQSRVGRVMIQQINVEIKANISTSMLKHYGFAYALPISKSRRIKPIYPYLNFGYPYTKTKKHLRSKTRIYSQKRSCLFRNSSQRQSYVRLPTRPAILSICKYLHPLLHLQPTVRTELGVKRGSGHQRYPDILHRPRHGRQTARQIVKKGIRGVALMRTTA